MKGFADFIREQGVVGLAVGFVMGGATAKLVSSLVEDLVNPIVGAILGATSNLESLVLMIGPIKLRYGHFLSTLIDFVVIALVVYFVVRGLGLTKLDKKKSSPK